MSPPDLICSYYTIAGVSPFAAMPSPLPFVERARACAAAGYAGIGIHWRDYRALRESGMTDQDLRAILNDYGMRHVEVEFLLRWFADGAAGVQARADEDTLYHMTDVFSARGMFLSGNLVPANVLPIEQLEEKFRALCLRAAARGVNVGVEPVAWSDVRGVEDALRLIEHSGARNSGLVLDPWHLYRCGFDYKELLTIPFGRILAVQLDDASATVLGTLPEDGVNSRLLPGEGAARVVDFVEILLKIGADIPLSVEVLSDAQRARSAAEAARVSYQAARSVIEQAMARAELRAG
jgi:sugar phosphate isomerase/epimerase